MKSKFKKGDIIYRMIEPGIDIMQVEEVLRNRYTLRQINEVYTFKPGFVIKLKKSVVNSWTLLDESNKAQIL